jgi:hypothetical protein
MIQSLNFEARINKKKVNQVFNLGLWEFVLLVLEHVRTQVSGVYFCLFPSFLSLFFFFRYAAEFPRQSSSRADQRSLEGDAEDWAGSVWRDLPGEEGVVLFCFVCSFFLCVVFPLSFLLC